MRQPIVSAVYQLVEQQIVGCKIEAVLLPRILHAIQMECLARELANVTKILCCSLIALFQALYRRFGTP
jgi:hypothetical protein